jgi:hypothetical protein
MLKDFFKKYLLFAIILFAIGIFPVKKFLSPMSQDAVFLNFLIFGALIFISTVVLLDSISKNNTNFNTLLFSSMILKMIIAIIYFFLTYKLFMRQLMIFVGSFFLAYLLFTTFEIVFLVNHIKKVQRKR